MSEINVVGKVARYRPVNCMEAKESLVISSRKLTNLAGDTMTLLKMDNGDEESASACYFDFSTASASS